MAGQERMTIEEVVRKVLRDEHVDVIRESVKTVAREIMEAEVSELIGAELGERRPDDRATHRNGYRPRRWDTRAGEIELQIPKLRQGSYFPSFLQPRKALGTGAGVSGPAGLCVRGLDAPRRSAGREPRAADQQVRGQPDRRAARRAGPGVPAAAAGGRCWRIPDRQRATQQKVVRPNDRQPEQSQLAAGGGAFTSRRTPPTRGKSKQQASRRRRARARRAHP